MRPGEIALAVAAGGLALTMVGLAVRVGWEEYRSWRRWRGIGRGQGRVGRMRGRGLL